ncbi:MAG: hypothetical protein ABI895_15820 [Deltaproteobacteria bacterium]
MTSPYTRLSCPVFTPEHAEHATEIAGFNTAVLHRPDVVVGAPPASDIAAALRCAAGTPSAPARASHWARPGPASTQGSSVTIAPLLY